MGFQLFSKAFPYLEKKYTPYATEAVEDPISKLSQQNQFPKQELTSQTKFLMSVKIRGLLRNIQMEQQNTLDKMSLEVTQDIDFSEKMENLSIAIENLEATAKSFLHTEETKQAIELCHSKEEKIKSKIVL